MALLFLARARRPVPARLLRARDADGRGRRRLGGRRRARGRRDARRAAGAPRLIAERPSVARRLSLTTSAEQEAWWATCSDTLPRPSPRCELRLPTTSRSASAAASTRAWAGLRSSIVRARSSAPNRDWSSRPARSAASAAADPSTPTTIVRGDQSPLGGRRATSTEHGARWSIRVATLPSRRPAARPRPCVPTTASVACSDATASRRQDAADRPPRASPRPSVRHIGSRPLERFRRRLVELLDLLEGMTGCMHRRRRDLKMDRARGPRRQPAAACRRFEHDVRLAHGLEARRRPVDSTDDPLEYALRHARRV